MNGEVSPGHAFFDGRRVRIDTSSGRRAFVYRDDQHRWEFEQMVEGMMRESLGENLYRKLLGKD